MTCANVTTTESINCQWFRNQKNNRKHNANILDEQQELCELDSVGAQWGLHLLQSTTCLNLIVVQILLQIEIQFLHW